MLRIINRYKCTLATTAGASSSYKHYDTIPGPKSYPLVGSIPNYLPGIGKKTLTCKISRIYIFFLNSFFYPFRKI